MTPDVVDLRTDVAAVAFFLSPLPSSCFTSQAHDLALAMRRTLERGALALRRAQALTRQARHTSRCSRCIQIRAAPFGETSTVNGVDLPLSNPPSSASSAGK